MSEFTAEKLDAMMSKIKSLIARADHPNTPEAEADTARNMAEKLMNKYRIEESELIESGALVGELSKPGKVEVVISPYASEYMAQYQSMLSYAVSHTGCKMAVGSQWSDESGGSLRIGHVVGYQADVRYAELLFMNAKIVFAERMEPKPNAELGDEENVYRMRSAGMERIRISALMGWGETNSATAKVTRLYKKACAARGEDAALAGRGVSVTVFREAYAQAFVNEFWSRLYNARNAADGGGGLVLADRSENVDEAFYEFYPHLRPVPVERSLGEEKSAKKVRQYRESKADRARRERLYSPAGMAGARAGANAAKEVNVGGNANTKRVN